MSACPHTTEDQTGRVDACELTAGHGGPHRTTMVPTPLYWLDREMEAAADARWAARLVQREADRIAALRWWERPIHLRLKSTPHSEDNP